MRFLLKNWRIITGCLVAPLLPSILAGFAFNDFVFDWSAITFIGLILGIAEVICIILALPIYFLWRSVRTIGIGECIFAGGLIGVLGGLLGVIVGSVSGFIFWLIAVKHEIVRSNNALQSSPESGASEL